MELPRALWPWRQSLSIFPRDLAITLGGIVDNLALLIGPLVSPDGSGRNEPDGIDGIGRRGSFERLLTTEWALADEAPLEFLRRVSTGELSFLEIAHKKPTVARKCLVLFDSGPDQRGGPRIVHLAVLILLAQRAYHGGANFSWGVLQDSAGELFSDVNEESVRKLLKATSPRRMVIEDVIRFYLQTLRINDEAEVWFVGGPGTADAHAGVGVFRVEIEDSFDPDAPFDLHVSVTGDRGKPRSVKLELPQSNIAVRLLRDPFQVARVVPQKSSSAVAAKSNIIFSRDYRKLFVRGAEGELLTIPIPNSPNTKETPKPRVFRPPAGETLIGVGRLMNVRTIVAVTKNDESVFVHELSTRGCTSMSCKRYLWDRVSDFSQELAISPGAQGDDAGDRLALLIQLQRNEELFLYDPQHSIFKLEGEHIRPWAYHVATGHQEGAVLYYIQSGAQRFFRYYTAARTQSLQLDPSVQDCLLAPGGFIATRISPSTWQVINEKGELLSTTNIPAENQVIGFMSGVKGGFATMNATRTSISFITNDAHETWINAPAPIKSINVIPGCWLAAFLTVEDELCIYSRDHKKLLLHMRLGDA